MCDETYRYIAYCNISYNGNDSRKKAFANDLLFPHLRENDRDLLHKVINNWACAHNELSFFSMDRERLTIWLTLTHCILRI